RHRRMAEDAEAQIARLKASQRFRQRAREGEIVAAISLHLSSHGSGIGAFNQGWLHDLKSTINRTPAYAKLTATLDEAALRTETTLGVSGLYQDTLRPSRLRSWDSYLPDNPELGGEISALSGLHGLTLATIQDNRPFWNTPYDLPDTVDFTHIAAQSRLVCGLIGELSVAPNIHGGEYPRDGLSAVTGRASFLRQGELFADQPAPGTVVMAFQGRAIHYAMVDQMGRFQFRSVTDKKHQLHKVILEAYRFDPDNGRTLWAIDKKQTGKSGYRVKMQRTNMETQLVMFPCKASTLFNLLEPRNFRYMTQIDLIDARLEASPLRYWWSRIDTRESTLTTLFLEPGTRFKLTLSDSILRKKLILTSATERRPEGIGYRVDDWTVLTQTELRTARDMWALLGPRIRSLESHGIYDERLARLQEEGTAALEGARSALEERRYSDLLSLASRSWALASRVYDQVEKTQKDVLFGVLFYIALFVPFAYCAERLLFSFRNIHKRIVAFLVILLLLIAVIYRVHPAFELAYSPTVVILAFFIMGLSLIVTLIIFFRFEGEMVLLQRRAAQKSSEEISRWKAFVAAFFLGVSNLRRRRVRTFLTCMTLIILTFTIMSFTSVKSSQHQTRVRFQTTAPYRGLLLKTPNWNDLPREASGLISRGLSGVEQVVPRVWLETPERTSAPQISLRHGENIFEAKGLVGLSVTDIRRSGLTSLLVSGRWFEEDEYGVAVISDRAATALGITAGQEPPAVVEIWGQPHRICGVFDSRRLQDHLDLDGEPLTPVTFPNEALTEITEVEFDALESGEDVKSFQSRYQHTSADVTMFMPYQSVLANGGSFKAAVAFLPEEQDPRATAMDIIERFGLMLFSGEPDGTFIYQSSDTIQYQGLPNVFIPMVISILIVLNTMIGSVYERKGEIGIYTSVGLAPSHVSFLFIAEALAFAVLSVVLGYLLAQGSAYGFAKTDLWSGITVNYSSMAGVGAMVLVIVVVLVSVIYPSRVAARIAIPDVNRSWRLPDHNASVMAIQLPFMVKRSELESAAGFLLDHFQSHQDVSHGIFSTGNITVAAGPKGASQPAGAPDGDSLLCIASKVWLAPFDFGILQRVEIRFQPSSVDGDRFLTIDLKLIREAGEAVTWGRVNREFVNMLRKQLLIWRNMDHQSAATYSRQLDGALTQSPSEAEAR
ncbi:MAG: ABC transporter permease, partial [Desulfobacterales bacterium]